MKKIHMKNKIKIGIIENKCMWLYKWIGMKKKKKYIDVLFQIK